MKAMILAAGKGKRFGSLTQSHPKALLEVHGKPLIVYRIEQLVKAGITEIVINLHAHAELIKNALDDGQKWNCHITYSYEKQILETAGGIIQALPQLGETPFIVCSCDTISDFNFETLTTHKLKPDVLGHLVLVDNPEHHQEGDYGIKNTFAHPDFKPRFNYAGFALLHPKLFQGYTPGNRKLASVFNDAMEKQQITAEVFKGMWLNVDTPERLKKAEQLIS